MVLWLFCSALLSADYSWSVTANKNEVYTNEAVELLLRCEFSDVGYGYSIEFENIEKPDYEIHLLSQTEQEHEGQRVDAYRFVLFAKRAGELLLDFKAVMKLTTKESIENSIIGRDNVEDLAFVSTTKKLPSLNLHVKEASTVLVGDFELDVWLSSEEVTAYKPLNMTLKITGVGNLEKLEPFQLNVPNVKIFAQKPQKEFHLTSRGYEGTFTQKFAIVSKSSYEIAPFELEYFDVTGQRVEKKASQPYFINVIAAYSKEELLDNEPAIAKQEDSKIPIFTYVIIFMTGLLIGRYWVKRELSSIASLLSKIDNFIWRIPNDLPNRKKNDMVRSIKQCKSEKLLLVLLIVADEKKYHDIIDAVELQQLPLKKAKTQAIKRTSA